MEERKKSWCQGLRSTRLKHICIVEKTEEVEASEAGVKCIHSKDIDHDMAPQ